MIKFNGDTAWDEFILETSRFRSDSEWIKQAVRDMKEHIPYSTVSTIMQIVYDKGYMEGVWEGRRMAPW